MKKSKKILSIVLAFVMVLGCMTMASAALVGNEAASVTVTSSAANLAAGETATITVAATTNFNVGTLSIPVFYDKTLVSVSDVTAAFNAANTEVATDADSANTDKVYANTGLDAAKYGFVLVNYIAEVGDTLSQLSNTTVLTFTVTALADVEGSAVFSVPAGAQKTTTNANGTLYFGATTETVLDNPVDNVENVDVTAASATITIGAAAAEPADLALTDAGTTAGVLIDTAKTFGGAYDGVVFGFTQAATNTFKNKNYITTNCTATNEGTLDIYTSDNKQTTTGNYGTGTTIVVKNADGSVAKTYVVVIFGDVDGNGLINVNDTKIVKSAISDASKAPNNSVTRMAANAQAINNATMLHTLNVNDTKAVKAHIGGTKINAPTLASYQLSKNNFYQ